MLGYPQSDTIGPVSLDGDKPPPPRRPRKGRPGVTTFPADLPSDRHRRAHRWLVERNQTPTAAAIEGVLQTWNGSTRSTLQRRKDQTLIGPAVTRSGPTAAMCVAMYFTDHGTGPTWGELAHQFGWPRSVRNVVIQELAKKGWLTFTSGHRSLRPGPAYSDSLPPPTGEPPADPVGTTARAVSR